MAESQDKIVIEPTNIGTIDKDTTGKESEAPVERDSTLERSLLGIFTDVQNGLAKRFRERTRHLGLSRSQWRVLSTLLGRPGSTQTELADLVGIGRAPLGKIIDRLEAQNWVERRDDPHDRRVNRLYLTRDVRPIVEPTHTISNQIVQELLSELPPEDRDVFARSLKHIHRQLGFTGQTLDP